MMHVQQNKDFQMLLSFLVGALLTVMPLPHVLIWFRPQWMLAILLYWIITKPESYGIVLAWFVGLFMDLLTGTPCGQEAIIFVVVTYFLMKLHLIVVHSPLWQQAVIVGTFAGCALVLQSILIAIMGHKAPVMQNELSVVTTVLIWPLIGYFLADKKTPLYL